MRDIHAHKGEYSYISVGSSSMSGCKEMCASGQNSMCTCWLMLHCAVYRFNRDTWILVGNSTDNIHKCTQKSRRYTKYAESPEEHLQFFTPFSSVEAEKSFVLLMGCVGVMHVVLCCAIWNVADEHEHSMYAMCFGFSATRLLSMWKCICVALVAWVSWEEEVMLLSCEYKRLCIRMSNEYHFFYISKRDNSTYDSNVCYGSIFNLSFWHLTWGCSCLHGHNKIKRLHDDLLITYWNVFFVLFEIYRLLWWLNQIYNRFVNRELVAKKDF